MKIRPLEAELFHADGRTDMTKLRAAFRNFENTPNIRAGDNGVLQHIDACVATWPIISDTC